MTENMRLCKKKSEKPPANSGALNDENVTS
jgi:hypothetical protein